MNANMRHIEREVTLLLSRDGGAELIDNGTGQQFWASDSDDNFREDFTELLTEADLEDVLDYLVAADILSESEADEADILMAEIGPAGNENGDEDDDGNGDEDDDEDEED
jgi:hypothetical protein